MGVVPNRPIVLLSVDILCSFSFGFYSSQAEKDCVHLSKEKKPSVMVSCEVEVTCRKSIAPDVGVGGVERIHKREFVFAWKKKAELLICRLEVPRII